VTTQPVVSETGFDRRTRLAFEIATWGTAAVLVGCAALPTADPGSRAGLLFCAGLLALFAILWFHVLPETVFGHMRFLVGTAISQVIAGILLVLTEDIESPYFVFYFLPTLATTFAMQVPGTIVVGVIAAITFLTIIVMDVAFGGAEEPEIALGAIRLAALLAIVAMTTLVTRTIHETRRDHARRS
jgi:hypothetical protein